MLDLHYAVSMEDRVKTKQVMNSARFQLSGQACFVSKFIVT